ncbi:hypothetical protein AAG570_007956 [Ranatra chinensis]|uniref:Uncharacterized protein n=1 Tax=Ranatra chinensis TaxID=642074 RepID=A0ABD0XW03_9HEMI
MISISLQSTNANIESHSNPPINALPSHTHTMNPPCRLKRRWPRSTLFSRVRIAATLGGFFSLMVLLVVYKSKCKSRSLSDENLEAAVAAAAAEEDRLGGGVYPVGAVRSMPPPHHLSLAHYPGVPQGPVLAPLPPLRSQYFPRSQPPVSVESPSSFTEDDEIHEMDHFQLSGQNLLQVPASRRSSRSSRRLSSITCSSCDTSYLERRGSALEMGLPIPPPFANRQNKLIEECWDFYYPIDIQVVQPTPDISPCQSQMSLFENKTGEGGLSVPKVAPLASMSSCGLASTTEQDTHSIGSDSVFLDEELVDTEDEVEEFSTDSDAENTECVPPSRAPGRQSVAPVRCHNRMPLRRFSSPDPDLGPVADRRLCAVTDSNGPAERPPYPEPCNEAVVAKPPVKSSSESDTVCANYAAKNAGQTVSFVSRADMSVSCDQLVKALQEHSTQGGSARSIVEYCTWSQETLF